MKAIVIDDEAAVRNGLLKYVHWEQLGIDERVAVDSVEKAMEYIEIERPELVISDICLPNMTGIDLGQWIRDRQYECRIIFISAYSDREYMKQAIVLSAEDYIDKPICIEQVETTIRKTIQKIRKDRALEQKRTEAETVLSMYCEQVMEKTVSDLLRGKWNEELINRLKENGLLIQKTDSFLCIIMKCEKRENSMDIANLAVAEGLLPEGRTLRIQKAKDIMVYLMFFSKSEYLTSVYRELEKLKTAFSMRAGQKIFIAVSEKCSSYKEIPQIYFQAGEMLQRLFFTGYCHVCFATPKQEVKEAEISRIPYEEFHDALLSRDGDRLYSLADRIYEYMSGCTGTLPDIIKAVYYEWDNMILETASGAGGRYRRNTNPERNILWSKINTFDTIQQCACDLKENIRLFLENEAQFYSENDTVNQIAFYVKCNYSNPDLSIKDISDEVHLTPAYMTALFKAKTDMTIGQLIKTVRLESAMFFLRDTKILLKDVSDRCGYANQNYFTKVFKKEYGITPTEYRDKHAKRE